MPGGLHDPYLRASYLPKLKETGTIVLTDLDGTHATKTASPKEMEDRRAVRKLLKKRGYVAGAVTARTPALTMSCVAYLDSLKQGYPEAPPQCGFDAQGKRIYVPLEELPDFAFSRDWDIVAGLGSGILLRNGKGYVLDRLYDHLLNYDYMRDHLPLGPVPWRQAILGLLADMWPHAKDHLSLLEYESNYHQGITDVMPLPYRIQLEFEGEHGLGRLREFKELLWHQQYHMSNPVALRTTLVDESRPSAGKYTVYLLPWGAPKERMINHLVSQSAIAAGCDDGSLRLFYAGDTPTDLLAGLYAGGKVPLTFLLATGSVLAPYLIKRRPFFGEMSLEFLWQDAKEEPRLRPTSRPGVFTCKVPMRPWTNTIVIGDVVYPHTTPPGSVAAFLEEFAQ